MPGHKDVLIFRVGTLAAWAQKYDEIGEMLELRSMIKVTKAVQNLIYITCATIPSYKDQEIVKLLW